MNESSPIQSQPPKNTPSVTQSKSSSHILISVLTILVLLLVASTGFLAYQNWQLMQKLSLIQTPVSIQLSPTQSCSILGIPGYQPATDRFIGGNQKDPANFQVDLKGNGSMESVYLYDQTVTASGGRSDPIIVKVFTGSDPCFHEEFSYNGKNATEDRSGNELGDSAYYPNFWGKNQNAFLFEPISTGYGSGFASYLNFLTYKTSSYSYTVIEGPKLNELSAYKFAGSDFPGKQILVAQGVESTPLESHLVPHRIHFTSYQWNGEQYIQSELRTTVNKYSLWSNQDTIDSILQKEPNVVK